ncbi:MarR family winged helix-turn-helix transcriptional regulator [Ornithinicoccus hortensis]|uniref:MarR family transcriptional regulator n=1 Tax=Ornithinicoccus hortensis TaxID=82346 RepID=A0A542YM84_9MICO|nr:MarR family transcriptional regulator [Ornithinicoccus hortensis]TQL49197.1 MarR family transcriptional regulator [Ornithinicoccus hortensis]
MSSNTTPAPTGPGALVLEEQVCFALSVAARSVVAVYKPLLEPLGLTHPQYLVMLALWEHESISVRDLSARLHVDPGTLSPLLKRLDAAGLVRRARRPDDERSLAVTLTPEGRALREDALGVPAAVLSRLGLEPDELVSLREQLTTVIAAASAPRAGDDGGDVVADG